MQHNTARKSSRYACSLPDRVVYTKRGLSALVHVLSSSLCCGVHTLFVSQTATKTEFLCPSQEDLKKKMDGNKPPPYGPPKTPPAVMPTDKVSPQQTVQQRFRSTLQNDAAMNIIPDEFDWAAPFPETKSGPLRTPGCASVVKNVKVREVW